MSLLALQPPVVSRLRVHTLDLLSHPSLCPLFVCVFVCVFVSVFVCVFVSVFVSVFFGV